MGYFVLVFFLGASVGSFVNVLIDRTMRGKDWVSGRSRCDACGKTLKWYDMVPLLSYWAYGGKSRCCGKHLTLRHPIVEGLFGALFVWWLTMGFLFFRLATAPLSLVQPVFWLTIAILLTIIAIADLLYGVILMTPLWIGIGWVVFYRLVLLWFGAYSPSDFGIMFVAGLGSFLFLWLLRVMTKGRGMGDGDPYLVFLTSLLLSWPRALVGVLASFIVGAIVGSLLILTGQRRGGQTIPLGPFIVIGAAIALVWGQQIVTKLWGL